ncbi:hypothetical protein [Pyrococcus abyssi]|uniref:Uncharacterized protein n=1 Tax=Pyrococcus abyssi (strain GE5 / Orsay) TaxID=272844 RepID=Q9V1S0_PYRAB|nr:hypothetical protein [Pyrococcus abyssi]CAB49279.1 Hypothetical protein PAB2111 [Pyrococcus abyssi GE5]CCE69734.1 TPA: hypothetical protein PAB2111 [Pyrococcus abyssi GE5]
MERIGKRYVFLIFAVFFVGTLLSLTEYYSPLMATALAFGSTVLAILVPWAIISIVSKKEFKYSTMLAFLLASLWEFLCSYLAMIIGYPLWKLFLNAGIGGIIVTVGIGISTITKAKVVLSEVK